MLNARAGAGARSGSEGEFVGVGIGRGSRELTGFLELNFAGTFDKDAEEVFGVAIYGCYDGRRDGLGEGLVCDLEGILETIEDFR